MLPGATLTIEAKYSHCRLRHLSTPSTSLFAICNGAILTIRGLKFEVIRTSWRDRMHYVAQMHFSAVSLEGERAGRVDMTDDVTFDGYGEIVHRPIARPLNLSLLRLLETVL